jgi:hypothetical protein
MKQTCTGTCIAPRIRILEIVCRLAYVERMLETKIFVSHYNFNFDVGEQAAVQL